MLLEEDGLIRARRGVGRFVSDTLPRIGIERIHGRDAIEAVARSAGAATPWLSVARLA